MSRTRRKKLLWSKDRNTGEGFFVDDYRYCGDAAKLHYGDRLLPGNRRGLTDLARVSRWKVDAEKFSDCEGDLKQDTKKCIRRRTRRLCREFESSGA